MRNFKIIASVVLMIALLFSISIFASADPLSAAAFGGLFEASLAAGGVSISSSGLTASELDDYYSSSTNISPEWLDSLSGGTVHYKSGAKTYSSVVYDYVFVSNTIAEFCASEGIGFLNDHEITASDMGNLVSSGDIGYQGELFCMKDPSTHNWKTNTYHLGTLTNFDFTFSAYTQSIASGTKYCIDRTDLLTGSTSTYSRNNYPNYFNVYFEVRNNVWYLINDTQKPLRTYVDYPVTTKNGTVDYSTLAILDFDPGDDGLGFFIPSTLRPAGLTSTTDDDFVVGSDTIILDILDSASQASASNSIVDASWTSTIPSSDTLGDTPYDTWMSDFGSEVTDTLGLIDHDIQDVNDTIGLVGEDIVDVIDTYGQSAVEAIENQTDVIDTYGQSAVDSLDNIDQGINAPLTGVKAKLDSLVDSLVDVGTNVLEAVKEEILGDIAKLETVFAGVITRLRNAMSIWHYVVEWIGSIGSVFGWIMGFASNTSYYMVLPIYACIAGGIVLGVYRRFGR